jgi:kinetochore protein NNF1
LNAKLQTTQSQNASLAEVLRRQKSEIEELVLLAEKVVRDADNAGSSLGDVGEEVAEGSRRAEGTLNTV